MLPRLGAEEMHNDRTRIEHYPVTGSLTFNRNGMKAQIIQFLRKMLGERGDMFLRSAGRNDHIVGYATFSGKINHYHIHRFIIVQRFLNNTF